jgi:uncharacterized protein (TIGR02147 family)
VNTTPESAEFLRRIYIQRRTRNPAYSTRAYARDLGMSQALLSLVLNGRRPLSPKQAAKTSVLLGLPREEAESLLRSTLSTLSVSRQRRSPSVLKTVEVETFKVLSHWYHTAILDLATTKDFRSDPAWIARRLGISPIEVRDALDRLLACGFLTREESRLRKTDRRIHFKTRNSRAAIRSFHQQMIAKASAALDEATPQAFERREISGTTLAVRSDRIAEARKRIQKFQKKIAAFLTDGECDEVYQLNVQLFPLTRARKIKSKEQAQGGTHDK